MTATTAADGLDQKGQRPHHPRRSRVSSVTGRGVTHGLANEVPLPDKEAIL